MKRDMNIIRKILLNAEDDVYPYGGVVTLEGVDVRTCAYHVALMIDAGLVEGRVTPSNSCPYEMARIDRLTNAGHDFADGIRKDTIWNKALEHVIKPGASYGLSVLVEYVKVQLHLQVFGAPPHT
jgi:hypothetical protein